MKSFIRIGSLFILLGCVFHLHSQVGIRQQVLCSSGDSDTLNNLQLRWTLGQCLGCGKLSNGSVVVTPGFPNGFITGPNQPCGSRNSFVFEFFSDTCGTYYSFEYTGTADIGQAAFMWDFGRDALPPTSTEVNPQDIVYGSTGPKLVSLTVTQDSCEETVSKTFFVDQIGFSAQVDLQDISCFDGKDGSISLLPRGGTPPYQIEWSDGSDQTDRSGLAAGEYQLTLSDRQGCTFETSVILEEPSAPLTFLASVDDETCTGRADGAINLIPDGGSPPYTFSWSDGSTFQNLTDISAGNYGLTLTDANECDTTTAFEVIDFCMAPDDFIANIITPNDDGMNDTWEIRGLYRFPNHQIVVYNRWGDVVWDTRNYQNDWRGTNNGGSRLPSGAYYYLIRLNDDRNTTFQGAVTIVR